MNHNKLLFKMDFDTFFSTRLASYTQRIIQLQEQQKQARLTAKEYNASKHYDEMQIAKVLFRDSVYNFFQKRMTELEEKCNTIPK